MNQYIQMREDIISSICERITNMYNTFISYSIILYNYSRLRFYEYLDIVGYRDINGVYCLYYTYNGSEYAIPVPRTRGPTPENPILSTYFKNNPTLMHKFMGPRGDWHGQQDILITNLNI